MKLTIKLNEPLKKRGVSLNVANMKIFLEGIDIPEKFKYDTAWDIQSTGCGIVVKGDHNIDTLKWFLEVVEKYGLEKQIRAAASQYIDAHGVLDKEFGLFLADSKPKPPTKKTVGKKITK